MKNCPIRFLSLLAVLGAAVAANATVIDFEGLSHLSDVGEAYAGLGVHFTSATALVSPNYNVGGYPPHSGLTVADITPNNPTTIHFDTMQSSVGAWFVSYGGVTMNAYSNGTLLGSLALGANYGGPMTFLNFSGSNITDVEFYSGFGPDFAVFDDLTFTNSSTSAVPGPLAAVPFALGLLRRRRKA